MSSGSKFCFCVPAVMSVPLVFQNYRAIKYNRRVVLVENSLKYCSSIELVFVCSKFWFYLKASLFIMPAVWIGKAGETYKSSHIAGLMSVAFLQLDGSEDLIRNLLNCSLIWQRYSLCKTGTEPFIFVLLKLLNALHLSQAAISSQFSQNQFDWSWNLMECFEKFVVLVCTDEIRVN